MKHFFYKVYITLFARPFFRKFNELLVRFGMKGLGLLNYESFSNSGEHFLLKTLLKRYPVKTMFDVGANEGDYTQEYLNAGYKGQVYCFEPVLTTFERLNQRMKAFDNVKVVNQGISNAIGEATIYDHQGSSGSGHATLYAETITGTFKTGVQKTIIQLTTIDHFVETNQIDHIDFMKLDIEGHELAALQGAKKTLEANKIAIMQIEFGETNIASRVFFRDIQAILPQYNLYRLLPNGVLKMDFANEYMHELFAFQNLVAVRNDISIF